MDLIKTLLILIVFFVGLILLVHICSKNKYVVEYSSKERKIKVYPLQNKPNQKTHR